MTHILHIDSSARGAPSLTRQAGARLVARLQADHPGSTVQTRDVAAGLPFVDADWVGANFTDAGARTAAQRTVLAGSDALVAELKAADILVIGAPIYNFSIPASLKAWIDQVARARATFRYTAEGPVGLLEGKKAYILVASGGTPIGSDLDFATPYLRHILGFVGISDVEIISARAMIDQADPV